MTFISVFFKLNDQLKMLKADVDKKDRLINELSSYREVERVKVCDHTHDSSSYVDKSAIEQVKREMYSLSAKHESVQSEVITNAWSLFLLALTRKLTFLAVLSS